METNVWMREYEYEYETRWFVVYKGEDEAGTCKALAVALLLCSAPLRVAVWPGCEWCMLNMVLRNCYSTRNTVRYILLRHGWVNGRLQSHSFRRLIPPHPQFVNECMWVTYVSWLEQIQRTVDPYFSTNWKYRTGWLCLDNVYARKLCQGGFSWTSNCLD